MLYNADDRESFENLISIHNDFKDQNQVGAYQILISNISIGIVNKTKEKLIKKVQAQGFIEAKEIPSYLEVRMDNG